jgi:hypothetical protein
LSFRILKVGDDMVEDPSGFTISFRQHGQPEVLRLAGEAIDISHPEDLAGQWTHADRPQRLTLHPVAHNSGKPRLNDELLQLQALKSQTHSLQRLIGDKKHKIHQLLRDDFRAFCSTIKKCDSLKCIFRTIMHKIPEYAHIVSLHFSHSSPAPQRPESSEKDTLVEGLRKQDGNAVLYDEVADPAYGTKFPLSSVQKDDSHSSTDHEEISPTLLSHHGYASSSPMTSHMSRQLSPTPTPTPTPTPLHSGTNLSPTPSPHHTMRPTLHFSSYQPRYHLYQLVPPILIFVVLSSLALVIGRHFNLLCASPNRRASLLCSREERCNRRLYRRAARRHSWNSWWNRYRPPSSTTDYDEKRTLILEQEGVLEDAMQNEIHTLALAQEIAREVVLAEEGRSRLYQQANTRQHSTNHRVELDAMPSTSSTIAPAVFRRVDSLPGHRRSSSASFQSAGSQPPPGYEEELQGDIDVADGFMYMPTFGGGNNPLLEGGDGDGDSGVDDATPDSSVVDCSPRMSFDTGRTTLTTAAKERD